MEIGSITSTRTTREGPGRPLGSQVRCGYCLRCIRHVCIYRGLYSISDSNRESNTTPIPPIRRLSTLPTPNPRLKENREEKPRSRSRPQLHLNGTPSIHAHLIARRGTPNNQRQAAQHTKLTPPTTATARTPATSIPTRIPVPIRVVPVRAVSAVANQLAQLPLLGEFTAQRAQVRDEVPAGLHDGGAGGDGAVCLHAELEGAALWVSFDVVCLIGFGGGV